MPRISAPKNGLAGALALLAGTLLAQAASAQAGAIPSADEEVMVRVDITNVAEPLAIELGVGTDALPRSVEVPVEVAAVVCDLSVTQLEDVRAVEQHVECKATSLSSELAAATEAQMDQ